ncbi:hypothetical protein HMPREF0454_03297 [Hafnia alvei ATCC 51873]|uniref:Uncharacterized protein n=1 Tax=Hafnia alvei ATCC 51873 TaxID=1002364 RepID=G9Y9N2_HAFAL|nr:hypothetical protein HMPREF0454_03297 [Hafnia alvei ATCC 51873]
MCCCRFFAKNTNNTIEIYSFPIGLINENRYKNCGALYTINQPQTPPFVAF